MTAPGPSRLRDVLAAGLNRLRRRRESALIVLVPEAEAVVGAWRERTYPTAETRVPAHVTVLYPFLHPRRVTPQVHEVLARAAATVSAFDYRLDRVGRFPGVVYLAPDVTAPFAELLAAVRASWPRLLPYGGSFSTFVPHVTVSEGVVEPVGLAAGLEAALPVPARARELVLIEQDRRGCWVTTGRFPSADPGPATAGPGNSRAGHMPGTGCISWTSISQPPGMFRCGWAFASSIAASRSSASMML